MIAIVILYKLEYILANDTILRNCAQKLCRLKQFLCKSVIQNNDQKLITEWLRSRLLSCRVFFPEKQDHFHLMPFVKSVDVEFLQKYAEASFSDIKTGQPKRDYFDFTVSVRPNVAFLDCVKLTPLLNHDRVTMTTESGINKCALPLIFNFVFFLSIL